MKTTCSRFLILPGAAAFALLFTVANAPALTNPAPAGAAAPVAQSLPAGTKTTLTPAVTLSSPAPDSGEDIRDIRHPRHVPTHWFWVAVAAGVSTLLAAALLLWIYLRRSRIFELSPNEIALERLEAARRLMHPDHAREYCFVVSQIIRGYVEEQLRLRAPRLTTEEFLRELVEGQAGIAGAHRALLGDFLQHCDLAKFAGWRYSLEALSDMHDTAIEFVQQSAATANPHVTAAPEIQVVHPEPALTHTPTNNL